MPNASPHPGSTDAALNLARNDMRVIDALSAGHHHVESIAQHTALAPTLVRQILKRFESDGSLVCAPKTKRYYFARI